MPRTSKDAAMIRCAHRPGRSLLFALPLLALLSAPLARPPAAGAEPLPAPPLSTPESLNALPAAAALLAPTQEADEDSQAEAAAGPAFAAPQGLRPGPRPDGRPLRLYRNRTVDSLVRFFLESRRDVLERGWRRSGRYLPMIRRVFREEGVPEALAYLAAVESNFNPQARSPAHAVGMWQFTAPTARTFGLRMYRPWYDERIDPESSTRAAARLLAYLYDRYGDWALALAAYNAGEARVNDALARARANGRPADYWSLRLPRQTQGFVPAFLAIAAILEAPAEHGLDHVQRDAPLPSEPVELSVSATLGDLAERLGVPAEQLVLRNPAWRGALLPPRGVGPVRLWVPPGTGASLLASLASHPPKAIPWLVHTVTEGETVSAVASLYGVRTGDILSLNHLHASSLLAINQPLLVPVAADTPLPRVAEAEPRVVPEASATPAVTQLRLHRVQAGESLWSIARQYGVRMAELRTWNQLSGPVLRPDQELVVYLPGDWTAAR
jgi:peptidoglycan lytic transglycosylase D